MGELGTAGIALRVAIVGSGPSGFYAAEALFKSGVEVLVDMFDRLPTPYGLVRLGVAPDHQRIKTVIRVYEKLAADPRFAFYGNVSVGTDITVDDLRQYYDAVIFTTGAQSDRRLNIPGEDLPGSHTATAFVAWYNGHPDYRDLRFDLSCETAVVIGQGNVAVDVCRVLAKTVDELRDTDIAQHALDALAESKVKNIHMIGRRGPAQVKFTQIEVKELGALDDCDPIVNPADMELDPLGRAEYDHSDSAPVRRVVPFLEGFSRRPAPAKSRRLHFHFLKGPAAIKGDGRVESIVLEKNALSGEPLNLKARGTGVFEEIPCGLVFRSVGYYGVPVPGVPFDTAAGVVPNKAGRVVEGDGPVPGMYVSGWIKRGPSGVIGTNKPDSLETVEGLLADRHALSPCPIRDSRQLLERLRSTGIRVVTFPEWGRIDAAEVARGKEAGKPREKFTRIAEMLDLLDSGSENHEVTPSSRAASSA